MPAFFDHRPVGTIAVHGDVHSAAAGSDFCVKRSVVQFGKERFKRDHIIERRGFADIAAVKKNVDADGMHALFFGLYEHCLQMIDMGMHVAVREKADEMQRFAGILDRNDFFPCLGIEHFSALDGVGNQLCALCKDLSGTDGVMTDLRVAHIVVARKTDSGTVRFEL